MKTTYIIIFLFFYSFLSYSQDTIIKKDAGKKFQIAIKASGSYKFFVGDRYIKPTPNNFNANTYYDDFLIHQFDGFTKIPTYGFQSGLLLGYQLHKNFQLSLGLLYVLRKEVFKSDRDTVIKYHSIFNYSSSSYYNLINNVIKYDYTSRNIELPIMITYNWKKINFYAGAHVSIFTINKAVYTYLLYAYKYPYNFCDCTTQKTFTSYDILPLKIFPSFQMSYDLRIKNISLNPFLGIDIGTKKSYFLQGGLILPLRKYPKK